MIYIIHKILVLIKSHLNYLKVNIVEFFFKKYNRLLFFFKKKKKEQNDTAIKDIINLFRLKKEVKEIKDIVPRSIKNPFEYDKKEENYNKPLRANNFWNNDYIKYKGNGDKSRILSVEEYLEKIRPYLRDIINDLKQSGPWKIQLTTTINFISSKDDNDEERVMY